MPTIRFVLLKLFVCHRRIKVGKRRRVRLKTGAGRFLFLSVLLVGCQAAQLADAPLVTTVESRLGVDMGELVGAETAVPPSLATAYAAATAVALPAAELEPGSSRRNPLSATTELITLNDWEIVVLEQLRGDAAWEQIRAANSNNPPPPPGEEYFLLKLWLKNSSSDPDERSIALHVTGNAFRTQIGRAHV